MNFIGNIGNFIIRNQDAVQLAAIIIIGVLIVVFAIKAISNGRRKTDILSQINEKVSDINSTVSNMGSKEPDVIYIDNRTQGNTAEPENSNGDPFDFVSEEKPEEGEASCATEETAPADMKETERNVKKYFDRSSGIDKNGKVYTEEELNNQIKE